ncbi:MAG TPA: hypothetical protein VGN72_12325 [Tepidisphaeraceae bacterium]|jgi:hypothetical protein|nr:hypothetical protein [Tepidisphaeraceae bacterium]
MTMHNKSVGTGLSMLGGIAAGAALMYLLDPEEGQARRENLSKSANDALSKAGTSLGALGTVAASSLHSATEGTGSAWSTLADKARELAQSIGEHASTATSTAAAAATAAGATGYAAARDTASDWANRASTSARNAYDSASHSARNAYDSAHHSARDAYDSAAGTASEYYDDARARAGYEEESSYAAPVAIGAGTAALLGAAAVYFLDKEKGADRRQQAVDLLNSVVVNTRSLAHRLADEVKGQVNQYSQGQGQGQPMDYATSDDYVDAGPEVGRTDVSGGSDVSASDRATM